MSCKNSKIHQAHDYFFKDYCTFITHSHSCIMVCHTVISWHERVAVYARSLTLSHSSSPKNLSNNEINLYSTILKSSTSNSRESIHNQLQSSYPNMWWTIGLYETFPVNHIRVSTLLNTLRLYNMFYITLGLCFKWLFPTWGHLLCVSQWVKHVQ